MGRPPSPTPSATESISLSFSIEPSASASISSLNNPSISRVKPIFWDFEAYSRVFLHEKKLIEKEVK